MEAWIRVLEEDLRTVESQQSPSPVIVDELEEREEEPSPLWAHPVVIQKMKSHQPMAPEGNPAGPAQRVEHMMYHPYMQDELVDLGKQFWQWSGEPLAVSLL